MGAGSGPPVPPAATMTGRNVDFHFLLSAVIAGRVGIVRRDEEERLFEMKLRPYSSLRDWRLWLGEAGAGGGAVNYCALQFKQTQRFAQHPSQTFFRSPKIDHLC